MTTGIGTAAMNIERFKPVAINRSKLQDVGNFNYAAIGRLRRGISVTQALAEMNSIQAALSKEFAKMGLEFRAQITPLQEQIVGGSRRGLLTLLGAIGVVLLIVCVNLGNLMLARATARS